MNGRWAQQFQMVESQPKPSSDPNAVITTGAIAILFPVVLVCSIIARRRHRQSIRQERIAQLERSWSIKSSQNLR
jgi:hypothetical protein